jgi:hypothetical protein
MRKYTEIAVRRAVVHVVAPKRGVLHKSIAEIVLDAPVRDFLIAHVTQGLADGQALAGRFKVVGADRTEGICRSITSSGTEFVSRSAALAQLLYDASSKPDGTDSRVSDGTLVVARCAATDGSHTNVSFVALLKLDPDDAFLADDGTDSKGRPVVRLVTQPNVLPTPRERIQKAAFVRATGSEYDALAVDRQRPGEVVSLFFLDGFLGLEHVYDAKERTSRLYKTLHRTFDQVKDELSDKKYGQLDQYLNGQVVGGRVNVDTIIDGMPAPQQIKQRFAEALEADLPDKEFDTDPETAEKLVKSRRFRGDNGLLLTVPSRFFREMVKAVPPPQKGGEWTITVRTKEWSER